jgi:DNA-binding response OmpR family regulator
MAASILLVEDDQGIALMYHNKLMQAGYQVTVAPDGVTAWRYLQDNPAPDLILLDIVMPKKDGFELLKDIRRDAKLKNINVVILTNLSATTDREEGERLGATAYIVKAQTTPAELLETVRKLLVPPPAPAAGS